MINYIKKQIEDFEEWGLAGVLTKIKNRVSNPIVKVKIKKNLLLAKSKNKKTILIVNGAEKTVSEIHRIFHLENKLNIINTPHVTLTGNLLNRLVTKKIYNFDLLYIHRSYCQDNIVNLINKFKDSGKKVIYDIDDLIFDKDKLDKIAFLRTTDKYTFNHFVKNTDNYLKIMKMADLIITPTDFLSEYIKNKYHLKTGVLRNHLDQKSLDNGKNIFIKNKNKKNEDIIIGYFPGTKTHQKDLEIINETLQKLLQKYPYLKLKIVGDPSLAAFFDQTKNQIILHKKVPYKKLMKLYRDVDINLAPSEINNDFCESKSELKYFFAGACGIPTIASATNAFEYAIKNGVNGYLCYKDKDWDKYLEELINNRQKRLSMGKKAFSHVQEKYNPTYQSQELKKILEKINFLKS